MQDPMTPRFAIDGGTLKITGDLHAASEVDLLAAVDGILQSGASPLVVDITEVMYRGSSYVRLVAIAMMRASDSGSTLTIRATVRTARILEMGGLEKLGTIETVPDA